MSKKSKLPRWLVVALQLSAAGVMAFLLALALWRGTQSVITAFAPEHHLDGQGALGSGGDPNSFNAYGRSTNASGNTWTVGIHLCLAQGDQPAVLDGSVTPTKTLGSDFVFLGAYVRTFTPASGDHPIGSEDGFPPVVNDQLHALAGYTVAQQCGGSYPDPKWPYTELLLGFKRGGGHGGGWMGIDVGYSVGGRHHVVSLGYYILMCGPAVPSQYCYPPGATPPGA